MQLKQIGVFLDDERNPEDVTWLDYPDNIEWIVVRTYKEFVKLIDTLDDVRDCLFSFDHDIQDFTNTVSNSTKEYTGLDCLRYLEQKLIDTQIDSNVIDNPIVYAHTKNIVGQKNMNDEYTGFLVYYYSL